MNLIITMAGKGERFRRAGYDVPKYQIEAKGRTLFDWSLSSLSGCIPHLTRAVFVARKEDAAARFIGEHAAAMGIGEPLVLELPSVTDGQATTALLGMETLPPDEPVLIYNIDTYVEPEQLPYGCFREDGCIPCFQGEGTHWSFVDADERGLAREVREKQRISGNCSLGAYYFASAGLYRDAYARLFSAGGLVGGERYIAPMYNLLIAEGKRVRMQLVDKQCVHVLGTPEELALFLKETL